MKKVMVALMFVLLSMPAQAALDELLSRLDSQARNDLKGFQGRISAQFGVSEARVQVVLSAVGRPADAFMVFQLGKFSGHPADHVLQTYQKHRGKGWGALAKELGIKPGSPEFHALKRGDFDLHGGPGGGHGGPGKSRKDKGKHKG